MTMITSIPEGSNPVHEFLQANIDAIEAAVLATPEEDRHDQGSVLMSTFLAMLAHETGWLLAHSDNHGEAVKYFTEGVADSVAGHLEAFQDAPPLQ